MAAVLFNRLSGVPQRVRKTILACCLSAAAWTHAATFQDSFAGRELETTRSGSLIGNNATATVEPGEPRHGGKTGGKSLWISWKAPESGLVTWDTAGSSFDTLLAAYTLEPGNPNDPPLTRLRLVGRADDKDGELESLVQFGVTAGTTYEIAVDGYRGASGHVRLRWDLTPLDEPPPIVLEVPSDRSLRLGDAMTLRFGLQVGRDTRLAWLFNGDDTLGVESDTLLIPSFQLANVGRYQLRITAGRVRIVSQPVELQVNSEGEVVVLARDKLFDSLETGLIGRREGGGGDGRRVARQRVARALPAANGLARGYNGVQIFNTVYASRDPDEPNHCNVAGGASYWLSYQAPAQGRLRLDTLGSSFDTLLAIYTYDPPLLSYHGLQSVACDNNSGGGDLSSRLECEILAGRNYLIVVDGVGGVRGRAHLNYQLTESTGVSNTPPHMELQPTSVAGAAGSPARLGAHAVGGGGLEFLWHRNGIPIAGAIRETLEFPGLAVSNAGSYVLVARNAWGSVTSSPVDVKVGMPMRVILPKESGMVEFRMSTEPGTPFVLESIDSSGDLKSWKMETNGIAQGDTIVIQKSIRPGGAELFRLR